MKPVLALLLLTTWALTMSGNIGLVSLAVGAVIGRLMWRT